ncbi:PH domain-containing protein [Nocardia neocaledoniensis]|uniref:PH domain-containing protein n=1 Tax=Nocardia neocaledoniensis TaxID=236511 RepID=UPI0024544D66|nr:PH domain-containing protein [Nocardia neocaledoniensis]
MLLVYPVTEVVKYIPVLLGSIIVGTTSGNPLWGLIPVLFVAAAGVARYFTTSYRIDADHVRLRTGIIQRKTLSVPRPRIRSVDVEADLLHRVLGLAVLEIGTGAQADKGEGFKLDALDTSQIPALRAELLSHTGQFTPGSSTEGAAPHVARPDAAAESGREIGHWRAAWVRYAPLSLTGLAIVAPIAGLGAQYGLIDVVSESAAVRHLDDDSVSIVAIVIVGLFLLAVVLVSLAACAQYLATWFGLRVIDNGATLHLRHGLFTTRQITLDLARFRGATLSDPLLLRAAEAAQLEMIMTGENPRQKILPQAPRTAVERTLDELLRTRRRPDTPKHDPGHRESTPSAAPSQWSRGAEQHEAAGRVQPTHDTEHHQTTPSAAPTQWSRGAEQHEAAAFAQPTHDSGRPGATSAAALDGPSLTKGYAADGGVSANHAAPQPITGATLGTIELVRHGPAAHRRRFTKAAWPVAGVVVALVVLAVVTGPLPIGVWAIPVVFAVAMAALAEDRYRSLGHRVLPGSTGPTWLITRRGSLDRHRDCLESPGIIGWTIRRTFWQRRAGLATVVAATAAGKKAYLVDDIPFDQAVALIEAVSPGLQGNR